MKSKKQPNKPAKETERGRAIAVYNPLPIFDEVLLDAKSRVERQRGFSRHLQLVYDAPDWSLATLLSWVIWRDQNRICDINRYSDWRTRWSAQARYKAGGINAMTAWHMVLTALQNGKLVAIENGAPLAAEHWYGVKATSKSASTAFHRNLHFRRKEVLKQYGPERTKAKAGHENSAVEELQILLKDNPHLTVKDAFKQCRSKYQISERRFKSHVWPTAREKAGLERRAPAGRKRKNPRIN